jgi:hypothetical protein
MAGYSEGLLGLIDSRTARDAPAKMGTVQWRSTGALAGDPGMYAVTVIFDGSGGTAQEVKCFESVIVDEGDRVGVIRYEGEWIVTGNYRLRTLADASLRLQYGTSSGTTSATFVDMPSSPTASPIKVRDYTLFRISIDLSLTSTVTGTVVELGAYVASVDGTVAYDEVICKRAINAAGDHREIGGWTTTAALVGGGYAVTGRWRRVSGTGTLNMDANDGVHLRVQEVVT